MSVSIFWPSRSLFEHGLARAFSRIGAFGRLSGRRYRKMSAAEFLNEKRIRDPDINLELTRSEAFTDAYSAPGTSGTDLRKLLENEAGSLSPVAADETELLPLWSEREQGYDILHVRADFVRELEMRARKLGIRNLSLSPEDAPDLQFELPAFSRQIRVSRKLSSLAIVLILTGLWLGLNALANRQESAAELAEVQEQSLRATVMERAEVSSEVAAFEAFAALNPSETSPQGLLTRLANLTEATPEGTWWSEVHLSNDEITVSAVSDDAGASLQAVADDYPDNEVRFAGAVSDLSDGKQSFTITILEGANNNAE